MKGGADVLLEGEFEFRLGWFIPDQNETGLAEKKDRGD
jgi:hypothetical protein